MNSFLQLGPDARPQAIIPGTASAATRPLHSRTVSTTSTTSLSSLSSNSHAYIVKEEIHPLNQSTRQNVIGIYASADDANSKVYALRLDRETCAPCFFSYGSEVDGGFLSWQIPSEEGYGEEGVKVFVEKVGMVGEGNEPVRDWRRAIEPMSKLGGEKWNPAQQ